jgi:hypothetical protein
MRGANSAKSPHYGNSFFERTRYSEKFIFIFITSILGPSPTVRWYGKHENSNGFHSLVHELWAPKIGMPERRARTTFYTKKDFLEWKEEILDFHGEEIFTKNKKITDGYTLFTGFIRRSYSEIEQVRATEDVRVTNRRISKKKAYNIWNGHRATGISPGDIA